MLENKYGKFKIIAGTDEAGRGCIAGPVVAASVIFPMNYTHKDINDSKTISKAKREQLFQDIIQHAVSYAIEVVSPQTIDEINILQASILGMNLSAEKLNPKPEILLVDGNRFKPSNDIPFKTVIKGDSKYLQIAAASILAKVYRDHFMEALDLEYPQYHWKNNAGYPTPFHLKALNTFGLTPWHRKTYGPVKNFLAKSLFD